MNTSHRQKIAYALCFGGLILHLKTAFWESSEPTDSSSIKLLAWSLIPYLVIIGFRKASYGALCAAIVVFLFDLFMHLEVFVWPSSSTAALGLLFMPLWNLVLFIPLSFLAGYFIENKIKKNETATS
jgi:hypothetical protein